MDYANSNDGALSLGYVYMFGPGVDAYMYLVMDILGSSNQPKQVAIVKAVPPTLTNSTISIFRVQDESGITRPIEIAVSGFGFDPYSQYDYNTLYYYQCITSSSVDTSVWRQRAHATAGSWALSTHYHRCLRTPAPRTRSRSDCASGGRCSSCGENVTHASLVSDSACEVACEFSAESLNVTINASSTTSMVVTLQEPSNIDAGALYAIVEVASAPDVSTWEQIGMIVATPTLDTSTDALVSHSLTITLRGQCA